MKVVKIILAINAGTLAINGIIIWLTIAKQFPAVLGILLFFGCIAGAIWFSCYVNQALPFQRKQKFYSAPTERMRSL